MKPFINSFENSMKPDKISIKNSLDPGKPAFQKPSYQDPQCFQYIMWVHIN